MASRAGRIKKHWPPRGEGAWDLDEVDAYDYELPERLIATEPVAGRDQSRLLVARAESRAFEHGHFSKLPAYVNRGDLLVFNNTRVIPARLEVFKETGGRVELFVLDAGEWEESCGDKLRLRCMTRSSKPLREAMFLVDESRPDLPEMTVVEAGAGFAQVEIEWEGTALAFLERFGQVPLPPYIVKQRELRGREALQASDRRRYQTVFASVAGAVAAPTAGLHFTPELLEALNEMGVQRAELTLSVGPGTFQPVRDERLSNHEMHREKYLIPEGFSEVISACRQRGGRVIAVGTTTARALEAEARRSVPFEPGWRSTDIFLRPGESFAVCDGLITNFHLPRSTLLALVAGFLGYERLRDLYNEAIDEEYRFYSYGDACLLLPKREGLRKS